MAGTASTVRSFLLVEHSGPVGEEALRDARMPTASVQSQTACTRAQPGGVLPKSCHARMTIRSTSQ